MTLFSIDSARNLTLAEHSTPTLGLEVMISKVISKISSRSKLPWLIILK